MAVLDLSAYKPVPATLGDANQIANGFQAVVNCINALDNNNFGAGKIFDPLKLMQDGATAGQALVWSAAANGGSGGWVPGNAGGLGGAVTVSAMAGGPPGSPADKDVWVATAVDAIGTRWIFQYNAGSGSAFKWEFVGGSAVTTYVATLENTSSAAFVDLATIGPSLTLARAGDYTFDFGYATLAVATGGGNALAQLFKNGSALVGLQASSNMDNINSASNSVSLRQPLTVAAADAFKLRHAISNAVSTSFSNRYLSVTPVRVS